MQVVTHDLVVCTALHTPIADRWGGVPRTHRQTPTPCYESFVKLPFMNQGHTLKKHVREAVVNIGLPSC